MHSVSRERDRGEEKESARDNLHILYKTPKYQIKAKQIPKYKDNKQTSLLK